MPGRLVHFEIPAEDTGRAKEFYGSLFGWKFQTYEGPVEYNMTEAGGEPGGGLYPRQSGETGLLVYFDTDDIDAGAARVRELGGSAEDKAPVPSMGWYVHCKDTEGNPFSLWQADESASAPGQAG
jgi:uncharacterized protein